MKKKKKLDRKKILIIAGAILVLLIIIDIIITQTTKNKKNEITAQEVQEIVEDETIKKLKDKTEIQRNQYYMNEFFRNIELRKLDIAYQSLADDFKQNYFPTQNDFEGYIKKYFPKEINSKVSNYERIGEYYVFWVDIDDLLGNKSSFSLNVVIAEYNYNDYKISFSIDSPLE